MWQNTKQTHPQTRETPAEYGGGQWVCGQCGSVELDESDEICADCVYDNKRKDIEYQAKCIADDGLEGYANDEQLKILNAILSSVIAFEDTPNQEQNIKKQAARMAILRAHLLEIMEGVQE